MNKLLVVIVILGVWSSGCVSTQTQAPVSVSAPVPDQAFRVLLGMTREEVIAIIGSSVVVGYEIDQQSGATRPIRADSLFATEIVVVNNETYQLDEYLLAVDAVPVPSPGKDREMMVFQNNILVARGDSEWQRLKEKHKEQ